METVKVLAFSFALWLVAKAADVLAALGCYDDEE